ncbi:MAG: hypothetical protein HY738_15655 [Bacteroidia bacterium]|nr:hypothetical protein [Bacteroidia bacterium]
MKQLIINISDDKYYFFLELVKNFNFININEKKPIRKNKKSLSLKFRNRIPKEVGKEMNKQLEQMRNEWKRDI